MSTGATGGLKRVLLTGAAGRLGRVARERLAGRVGLLRVSDIADLGEARPGEEVMRFDLADAAAVDRACEGIDAVIHFGGVPREASWDELAPANVLGLIHLYEAARRNGVDRVLLASSNHVTGLYRRGDVLDHRTPPRPDSRYGVAKAFGEDLAYAYAWKWGVRGFCMRIGQFAAEPTNVRALSVWLSHGDLARLLMTGLTADYVHEIVYGASRNTRAWWDNSRAYALGYDPQDDAERFADRVPPTAVTGDPVADELQGSTMAATEMVRPLSELP
jgi:uronate dehydrogenase